MRVAALYVVVPVTRVPPGPRSSRPSVDCCTGSVNVAVTLAPTLTPVAPGAGVRAVTVGLVVSGPSSKTTSTQ